MRILTIRQNRRLLFRSYLVLVGGFVVVATALDFGFGHLQQPDDAADTLWANRNLSVIEGYLAAVPVAQRPAAVADIEARLGFPVALLPPDHVVQAADPGNTAQEVFDADGKSSFIKYSTALDAVIKVGPVATGPSESLLLLLIPPLLYLSLFAIVGVWVWALIRELNVLTDAARQFASDYRQPTNTADKVKSLGDLAASMDEMSARINHLIIAQKELTGALSHEMRTPLARIKFAMAMLDKTSIASDELQSIEQDIGEIDSLISAMLDYARLDHADMEINLQLIPLDEWADQIVRKYQVPHSALRIENAIPAESAVMDPDLMELALSNLLANASRYASSLIQVRFERVSDSCSLSVDDDGQGIPEGERDKVFKAFTRLDNSRNRDTGGYGLGLALVRRVASLHGGSATVDRSSLGGARFTIEWSSQAG